MSVIASTGIPLSLPVSLGLDIDSRIHLDWMPQVRDGAIKTFYDHIFLFLGLLYMFVYSRFQSFSCT